MTRRAMIEILLERYGDSVTVNGQETAALIQPLRTGGGFAKEFDAARDGEAYYRYTGPAGVVPEAGQEIVCAGQSYTVLRAGMFSACGEEVYAWAVLRPLAHGERAEIVLTAGGADAARADSCAEEAVQQSRPVGAWGEREPSFVAAGPVRYRVTLYGVRPEPGIDLPALSDFTVIMRRDGEQTVYSGCRWTSASVGSGIFSRPLRTLELTAAGRVREGAEQP
ncbi:MAG: hypothetical protein GX424_01855 [Clostridiales bacterium]|nr:hypothetical protein [Clostridiales bacterium]